MPSRDITITIDEGTMYYVQAVLKKGTTISHQVFHCVEGGVDLMKQAIPFLMTEPEENDDG